MKAIANPVEVDFAVITQVIGVGTPFVEAVIDWGGSLLESRTLSPGMLARYVPVVGDYFVRQADGYEYVNPKDVFERKYRKVE